MFSFFSDIKTRITALEAKVEAIFSHLHTTLAAQVVKVADVPEKVSEAAATETKDVVATVVSDVEKGV